MLGAFSLGAQQRLNDTINLDQVLITAAASQQQAYFAIDSLELQNNPAGDLASLLSRNAPVFIKTAAPGSLATISMRGTLASHTQVSWNGIKINSPMLGQVDFSLVPTFFTDQVRIFSGPNSLQQGSGGLGGYINLASQGKWNQELFGLVSTTVGSYGTYRTLVDLGGNSEKFQGRIRLFRHQSRNDFPFLNTANGLFNRARQQNADYWIQGVLAQVFFRPNANHLMSIQSWIQSSDRNLPPIMSYEGSGREEYQLDQHFRGILNWQYDRGNIHTKVSTGLSIEEMSYYLAHQTGGGLLVNYASASQSKSVFNRFTGKFDFSEFHHIELDLHSDYHQVNIADEKTGSGYTGERLESGVFVKWNQMWTPRFTSFILVQQEWTRLSRLPILPSINLNYSLVPNACDIHLTLSKNFHLPTLNDLHWVPGGNPDLLPESGYQAESGIVAKTQWAGDWSCLAKLNGFVSYIDNWILWKPGEFQYWSPENIETVLARGLETSLKLSKKWARHSIDIRTQYTLTRTHPVGFPHQLMYIPVHKGSAFVHWKSGSWFADYQYAYVGERSTSTTEEFTYHQLPAYALHDLGIGKSFEIKALHVEIKAQVFNLLNTDYQSLLWRAMPGRHAQLNLKIAF